MTKKAQSEICMERPTQNKILFLADPFDPGFYTRLTPLVHCAPVLYNIKGTLETVSVSFSCTFI